MGGRNRQAATAMSDGAAAVEEVQFTLGEGPGVDAYSQGRPIFVEDLCEMVDRWTQFVPAAQALGIGAVFALPLQVGPRPTGVLSLYTDRVHRLASGEGAALSVLAELVIAEVLAMQAASGTDELAQTLSDAAGHRAIVHQATGMVAMQLECSVQDALSRLRGRAFLDDTGIEQVAQQVVDRAMRFES